MAGLMRARTSSEPNAAGVRVVSSKFHSLTGSDSNSRSPSRSLTWICTISRMECPAANVGGRRRRSYITSESTFASAVRVYSAPYTSVSPHAVGISVYTSRRGTESWCARMIGKRPFSFPFPLWICFVSVSLIHRFSSAV